MNKIFEDRDSFHYNFMITALAGQEITDKIKEYPRVVTMQINGEEIDPVRALDRLDKVIDDHIEKRANEIVEGKIADILKPFEEQVEHMTDVIRMEYNKDDLHLATSAKIKESL